MKMKNKSIFGMFLIIGMIIMLSFSSAYMRSVPQYVSPGISISAGGSLMGADFTQEACNAEGQDFIIQIAPFGCDPSVVRSDMLEENNMPVFCQLSATKLNPLIKVEAIDSIQFTGDYPREVASVGFHPAKAALGYENSLNSPVMENIGYVLINLNRQPNESAMPDYVEGNLTARIRYDIKEAFGVGKANFYLNELTSDEWDKKYTQYGFWNGRAYIRAEAIDNEGASISIYSGENRKISNVRLKEGEISNKMYIPSLGLCLANFQVKLNNIDAPDTRAKLKINSDVVEVTRGERFLDNKCQIISITKHGVSETVNIRCTEDDDVSKFDLKISPRIKLRVNGELGDYSLGDQLYAVDEGKSKFVYVGYIGETSEGIKFMIPVVSPSRDKESFMKTPIFRTLPNAIKTVNFESKNILFDVVKNYLTLGYGGIAFAANFLITGDYPVGWIYEESSEKEVIIDWSKFPLNKFGFVVSNVDFVSLADAKNADFPKTSASTYDEDMVDAYKEAMKNYNDVLGGFSGEQDINSEYKLGEQALYEKIKLAYYFSQMEDVKEFCHEVEESYIESTQTFDVFCNDDEKLANSEISMKEVLINGKLKEVVFEGIYEPSFTEYGSIVYVTGFKEAEGEQEAESLDKRYEVEKGVRYPLLGGDYFELISVDEEYITVKFNVKESIGQVVGSIVHFSGKNTRIKLNDYEANIGANKYSFSVDKINIENVAQISIIPNVDYQTSQADFKFKIGIEKRNIQLSPSKIKEKIEKLDKSIAKLENINKGLGGIVELGKTACLYTGMGLTVKNFFENLQGKGIARQKVMRTAGGWYDECNRLVNIDGNGINSQSQCLLDNSEQIDKEVDIMLGEMDKLNENQKRLQEDNQIKSGFFKEAVDQDGRMEDYSQQIQSLIFDLGDDQDLFNVPGEDKPINLMELNKSLNYSLWKISANYDLEQLKDIELYTNILNSDNADVSEHMKDVARNRLYDVFVDIKKTTGNSAERKSWLDSLNVLSSQAPVLYIGKDATELAYGGLKSDEGVPYQLIPTSLGGEYIAILKKVSDDTYAIDRTSDGNLSLYDDKTARSYIEDGKNMEELEEARNYPKEFDTLHFKVYDRKAYVNPYNKKDALVRYYEREPYKGMPAIVPFDLEEGWYAGMKTTLPIFGNIASYDKSGRVNSFYLCNIGDNKKEEFFSGFGDDICQMINLGTGQPYNAFSGFPPNEAKALVDAAKSAIEQASIARARDPNLDSVRIGKYTLGVGEPAIEIPDMQCEDFMSPTDCNLMFNVCDPVVCPPSRCDFGGKYPVRDVIQSGVIGSTMLCLPNWNEGIKVPVCLTGIYAGLDSWLNSVQKPYRACLQENLDTGKTIGICDEIYSIYGCDFFWRQAAPLAKIAIPKALGNVLKQDARGGGEYLGVQDAWDRASNSVSYFTQYYAENSMDAFKARSTDEVGSAVCKNYASLVFPTSGDILGSITTPDSPHTAHGRFSAQPYTTVTNPPISQYKVSYTIYAGSDAGAYYRVYLTQGSAGSYYQDTTAIRMVDSDYISVGDTVTEAKDFLAPTGYDELCINVNGNAYCGFKEVSTSFAVNYMQDQYVKNIASQQNIKTEQECISGKTDEYNILSTNLQSGVEEMIDPKIYNREIIRLCATRNPGERTDGSWNTAEARWKPVGYCGNEAMTCWLDTDSVNNSVNFEITAEEALKDVTQNYMDVLMTEGGYLDEEQFEEAVDDIEKAEDFVPKLDFIEEVIVKVFHKYQKGNLYLIKANVFRDYVWYLFDQAFYPAKEEDDGLFLDDEIVEDFEFEDYEEWGLPDPNRPEIPLESEGEEMLEDIFVGGFDFGEYKEWEFLDDFISPVFEFEDGRLITNVYYQYDGDDWRVSVNERDWVIAPEIPYTWIEDGLKKGIPDERNQEFIQRLDGMSYSDGLKLLIQKTIADEEGGLVNPDLSTNLVNMDDEQEFTVNQEFGQVYFRQIQIGDGEKEWYWSINRKSTSWEKCPEIKGVSSIDENVIFKGYSLSQKNKELILSLNSYYKNDFYNGAIIIFGFEEKTLLDSNRPDVDLEDEDPDNLEDEVLGDLDFEDYNEFEPSGLSCQETLGEEIKIAAINKKIPYTISDDQVRADTGAKNFECLVLQQALQESFIKHCKENRAGDCLYCDGDRENVLKSGYDESSYGVMQINIDAHPNMVEDAMYFGKNVDYGINYLIERYGYCKNQGAEDNWLVALNSYNGLGCVASGVYGDHVMARQDQIMAMFPECFVEDSGSENYPVIEAEYPVAEGNYPVLEEYPYSGEYPVSRNAPFSDYYPVEEIRRLDELNNLDLTDEAELLRQKIAIAINARQSRLDRAQSEYWAKNIIREMIDLRIPLEEKYVSMVVSTIERESNFRADPLTPDMDDIILRKLEEYEEEGFFSSLGGLKPLAANSFYEKYQEEISYIRTEGQLDSFIDNLEFWEKPFLESFRPETIGSMQLNIHKAIILAEKYDGVEYSEDEMRAVLYQLEGGLHHGMLYLNEIIDAYTEDHTKSLTEENIKFIAADYQSGLYASRNSAVQDHLNKLMGTNLVLDGDLGPNTTRIANDFFQSEGREDLMTSSLLTILQDSKELEDTEQYQYINPPEYAIIPENTVDVAKYNMAITSSGYVAGTYKRYEAYCGLLNC